MGTKSCCVEVHYLGVDNKRLSVVHCRSQSLLSALQSVIMYKTKTIILHLKSEACSLHEVHVEYTYLSICSALCGV